jgi:uncharacterized coiled-coil DUF342 family protein
MDDMMAAESSNVSLIVSIGSVIATGIGVLSFWMRLSDRITKAHAKAEAADAKADDALQDAAEAKNESINLREEISDMVRALEEKIERSGHDFGESLQAIRQNSNEIALYVRDNFARRDEVKDAIDEIKESQLRLETKFDKINDRMRDER